MESVQNQLQNNQGSQPVSPQVPSSFESTQVAASMPAGNQEGSPKKLMGSIVILVAIFLVSAGMLYVVLQKNDKASTSQTQLSQSIPTPTPTTILSSEEQEVASIEVEDPLKELDELEKEVSSL